MRSLLILFSIFSLSVACGGGDGDGGSGDGGSGQDAGTDAAEPDAPPAIADGRACTASQENPNGDCPEGYGCLSVQGGGSAACRLLCDTPMARCAGYTGPGQAFCIVGIQDANGQTIGNACATICADTMGTVGCGPTVCDGNCPGVWSCTPNEANPGISICE